MTVVDYQQEQSFVNKPDSIMGRIKKKLKDNFTNSFVADSPRRKIKLDHSHNNTRFFDHSNCTVNH